MKYPESDQEFEPTNINLLLGSNGTGKTTVLKALALAALSPIMPQSGFLPYRLVRRVDDEVDSKEATIQAEVLLHPQDLSPRETGRSVKEKIGIDLIARSANYDNLVSKNVKASDNNLGIWEKMYDDASPAFLVVGYGATRRVEDAKNIDIGAQQKSRLLRYRRVAGLFESQIRIGPIIILVTLCSKEKSGRYKQIVKLVDQLLPDEAEFSGEYVDEAYIFKVNGVPVPFDALSDGYRAYIGWIGDLIYHMCNGGDSKIKLSETRGLVLVDEIDLHLHPEWQRFVISSLSRSLPNLQFVFTTHSPLIASSLHSEDIYIMELADAGESIVRQYHERIFGLDAEQVLLSSYFGLRTTRAESFVNQLRELSIKAGEGDEEAVIEFMRKRAEGSSTIKESILSNGTGRMRPGNLFSILESIWRMPLRKEISSLVAFGLLLAYIIDGFPLLWKESVSFYFVTSVLIVNLVFVLFDLVYSYRSVQGKKKNQKSGERIR